MPDEFENPALKRGANIVMGVLVAVTLAVTLTDFALGGLRPNLLTALEVARLLFLVACWRIVRSTSRPLVVWRVLMLGLSVQLVLAAVIGELRSQPEGTIVVMVALCMGSAILLPWDWRSQAAINFIAFSILAVFAGIFGTQVYTVQAFAMVVGAMVSGVYLSYEIGGTRRMATHWDREAQGKHGELERLSRELEDRVDDSTHELKETAERLAAFCQAVSHHLHPPLRTFDGYTQLALDSIDREEYGSLAESLEAQGSSAKRLAGHLDELLADVRRARKGLNLGPMDLSVAATATLQEFSSAEPDRDVSWEVEPGLTTERHRRELVRVLGELLRNAWEASADWNDAKIEVGQGFDSAGESAYFVRRSGSATAAPEGNPPNPPRPDENDQGLALADRILRKHGGRLWSDPGIKPDTGLGHAYYFSIPDRVPAAVVEAAEGAEAR